MNVIPLTVFIGLVLVAFFVAFFLRQSATRSGSGRAALMPLEKEEHHIASPTKNEQS